MTKRFVTIDYDELYYTIDTKGLKTLNDFIKETNNVWNEDESLTEDKVKEIALEEYGQYLYENSMSSAELENKLNNQDARINELESENQKLNSKIKKHNETISQLLKMIQEFKEKDWIAEVCGDKYNDL